MRTFMCGLILGASLAFLGNAVAWREDDPREWQRDADYWQLRSLQLEKERRLRDEYPNQNQKGGLGNSPC